MQIRHLTQGHVSAHRKRNGQVGQAVGIRAQLLRQANDDVDAPVALVEQPGDDAALRGRDDILQLGDRKAQAGQHVAFRLDRHDGQTRGLLDCHIRRTGHGIDGRLELGP